MTTTSAITADLLDMLAEIAPDSPLAAARITRDEATRHIQGSYLALFADDDGADFSLTERLTVARQVADWHQDTRLAQHYAHRLTAAESGGSGVRLKAALDHAERLSRRPATATPVHLEELQRAGWSLDDIVTLSQLVAFVGFQSRLLRGYRLIA